MAGTSPAPRYEVAGASPEVLEFQSARAISVNWLGCRLAGIAIGSLEFQDNNPFVAPGDPPSVTRLPPLLLVAAALLALAALPAAAYDESDAGLLRPDVLEAGHAPAVVQPHTQWQGHLTLRPGHRVVAAQYQICRVGEACFAPPAPATRVGNDTFQFDTADYKAGGHPVDYQPGWRLGVQWLLTERADNGTLRQAAFPAGPDASDPACKGDARALACQERHYLAFDVAPAAANPAPLPGLVAPVAALLGVAWRVGRRHG